MVIENGCSTFKCVFLKTHGLYMMLFEMLASNSAQDVLVQIQYEGAVLNSLFFPRYIFLYFI